MKKLLNATQLATLPTALLKIESRQAKAYWAHVINLSPYIFELQDEQNTPLTVVTPFRERTYRLKVRHEYLWLAPVATWTGTATIPTTAYAVYVDVENAFPVMPGNLVT